MLFSCFSLLQQKIYNNGYRYATILAFDVKVERDAQELADSLGVKIFQADIIYHLFDKFTAYREELKQKKREEFRSIAVFPCKLKVFVEPCVFSSFLLHFKVALTQCRQNSTDTNGFVCVFCAWCFSYSFKNCCVADFTSIYIQLERSDCYGRHGGKRHRQRRNTDLCTQQRGKAIYLLFSAIRDTIHFTFSSDMYWYV